MSREDGFWSGSGDGPSLGLEVIEVDKLGLRYQRRSRQAWRRY